MPILAGYSFQPSRYEPELGHAGFIVEIPASPEDIDKAVNAAIFPIFDEERISDNLIQHVWGMKGIRREFRLAPGPFRLLSVDDDCMYGYSFGGELDINDEGDRTVCSIKSSAPVFSLVCDMKSPTGIMIITLRTLLARVRANWGIDVEGYALRLSQIDPFDLFISSLVSLEDHFTRMIKAEPLMKYQIGRREVRGAKRIIRAAGKWPLEIPPLAELLNLNAPPAVNRAVF
jgi:hypothetical protein